MVQEPSLESFKLLFLGRFTTTGRHPFRRHPSPFRRHGRHPWLRGLVDLLTVEVALHKVHEELRIGFGGLLMTDDLSMEALGGSIVVHSEGGSAAVFGFEGEVRRGVVKNLADFGAFVKLEEGIEGLIYNSELSSERVEKPSEVVQVGNEFTALITKVDPLEQKISLSIRALTDREQRDALKKLATQQAASQTMTLGDLLAELPGGPQIRPMLEGGGLHRGGAGQGDVGESGGGGGDLGGNEDPDRGVGVAGQGCPATSHRSSFKVRYGRTFQVGPDQAQEGVGVSKLSGKRALVTGASRGIGAAIAEALAREASERVRALEEAA